MIPDGGHEGVGANIARDTIQQPGKERTKQSRKVTTSLVVTIVSVILCYGVSWRLSRSPL